MRAGVVAHRVKSRQVAAIPCPHGLARGVLWLAGVFRHFVLFLLRFMDTFDAIEAYVVWRWRLRRMSASHRRWPRLVRRRGLLGLLGLLALLVAPVVIVGQYPAGTSADAEGSV